MRNFAIILTLLSITSCKIEKYEIYKIAIASRSCHAQCPFQAVQIDSNLNYQYFGGQFSKLKGYYYGKYQKERWEELVREFNRINLDELKNTHSEDYQDWPIEIIIYSSKGKKHIKTFYEDLPRDLQKTWISLLDSYKEAKLEKLPKKLQFETTYQYQLQGEPKFPPKVK